MASFGNISASSLLSSANAAANKTQSYNDSLQAYAYQLGQVDFPTYQSYLTAQKTKYANDPIKALNYDKTLTSATRTNTSRTISDISTQIKYGSADLGTKYNTLSQLRDAAAQNGDYTLAQSLESQMASVSVQQQNAATAGAAKASTAAKKGVDQAAAKIDEQQKVATELARRGLLSMQDLEKGNAQAMVTKADLYTKAANGAYGDLGASQSDYLTKASAITSQPGYLDAQKNYSSAVNGQPHDYLHVDPANRDSQGMIGDIKALPGVKTIQNPDGSYSHVSLGGWQDKVDTNGKSQATSTTRQDFINNGGDYIANFVTPNSDPSSPNYGKIVKGKGGTVQPAGSNIIADPNNPGAYYMVDPNGNKHYVSTDPNALLQRSQTPIIPGKTDKPVDGGSTDSSFWGANGLNLAGKTNAGIKTGSSLANGAIANGKKLIPGMTHNPSFTSPAAVLGGLKNVSSGILDSLGINHAQVQADSAAAAKAAQNAWAAHLAALQASTPKQTPVNVLAPKPAPLPAVGSLYYPSNTSGITRAITQAPAASAPQTVKTTALVDNLMGYSPTNGK